VPGRKQHLRALAFAVLAVAAIGTATAYVTAASIRERPVSSADKVERLADGPQVIFLQTQGDAFRRVAWARADGAEPGAHVTDLQCQRVYFAAGRGLCVGTSFTGGALVFDRDFKPLHELAAGGLASRARVSPDGRYGSMTFFVRGDSYADAGFSTRTTIIDMASGERVGDLEAFSVSRDGAPFRSVDFNFWGVTFAADPNRFYATLGTRGETFLVRGDLAARQLTVLRSNVECPSLSPDGTRIAFKERIGSPRPGSVTWRLAILDLATNAQTVPAESRSVDDQVEWLDNDRIMYAVPDQGPPATIRPDLWSLDLRGGAPVRVRIEAMSPVAAR
jgi:hypothetical protein